ncbi:MAG: amino acid permease [Planctomycetaceae bacterium]|nr:amino acid permease [Planctomycetaceae bacterium]
MAIANPNNSHSQPPAQLKRQIGVLAACLLGLGSILGTGVFVSLATAAEATGPSVLLAVAVAAGVAACNGLSSAQLAANHPVSGGTYEYGYRWLRPQLGFTAGWMFLCAKSASAATAALGFAGYLLHLLHGPTEWLVPIAVLTCLSVTLLTLTGLKRSSSVNTLIVSVTIGSLLAFVVTGFPVARENSPQHLRDLLPSTANTFNWPSFLKACALMFVAYTGYGRIATLGEEIHHPRRSIPRAIIVTLLVSMLLYIAVAGVAIGSVGANGLAAGLDQQAAPLEVVAQTFPVDWVQPVIAIGAMTAMLGVLLNLVLGLSRVVLAMARRGDLPTLFARLDATGTTPWPAVLLVGALITLLATIGSVKTTWSFSAFTVLIYYALTNLAALQLSSTERLYPRVVSWLGLLSCLFLAIWVEAPIWGTGLSLILLGLLWQRFMQRRNSSATQEK